MPGGQPQVYITPRVKRLMDRANDESNKLKDEFISTEHLFLAILAEDDSASSRILTEAGVTYEDSPGRWKAFVAMAEQERRPRQANTGPWPNTVAISPRWHARAIWIR